MDSKLLLRTEWEASISDDNFEDLMVQKNASLPMKNRSVFYCCNVIFAFVNMITAAVIFLGRFQGQSRLLPVSTADFRMQT